MSDLPIRFAVDASVGVKLFVEEEFSEQPHALFSYLAADPPAELYVPDLFYIECTNILLKYTRRFGRSLADSQADIADLKLLSLRVTSTADLMEESLLLAVDKNLTAYDACYAILAQRLNIPLITADNTLASAIESAAVRRIINQHNRGSCYFLEENLHAWTSLSSSCNVSASLSRRSRFLTR